MTQNLQMKCEQIWSLVFIIKIYGAKSCFRRNIFDQNSIFISQPNWLTSFMFLKIHSDMNCYFCQIKTSFYECFLALRSFRDAQMPQNVFVTKMMELEMRRKIWRLNENINLCRRAFLLLKMHWTIWGTAGLCWTGFILMVQICRFKAIEYLISCHR